jgi:hypothetical protein
MNLATLTFELVWETNLTPKAAAKLELSYICKRVCKIVRGVFFFGSFNPCHRFFSQHIVIGSDTNTPDKKCRFELKKKTFFRILPQFCSDCCTQAMYCKTFFHHFALNCAGERTKNINFEVFSTTMLFSSRTRSGVWTLNLWMMKRVFTPLCYSCWASYICVIVCVCRIF